MKNWFNTPSGVVVSIVALMFISESSVEFFVEDFLAEQLSLSPTSLGAIHVITEISIITTLLYFLVFRRITKNTTELLATQAKLKATLDAIPDLLFEVGLDGRYYDYHSSRTDLLAAPAEVFLGKKLSDITPPDVAEICMSAIREANEKGWSNGKQYELTLPQGKRWFELSVSRKSDRQGDGHRFIALARDITERKKMETVMEAAGIKLAQLNADLFIGKKAAEEGRIKDDALLASLSEGMIATDKNGLITTVNRAAEDILGWREYELIGKMFIEVVVATDEQGNIVPKEKRPVTVALTQKEASSPDQIARPTLSFLYYIRKDGERIPIITVMTPIVIKGEIVGTLGTFHDTTKEMEIDKTRGDLLALASHQLRTPLSGTKWLIETLQSGLKGALNKDQKEYLAEIYKINQRMTALVVDMLGVLRLEGGSINTKKSSFSTKVILDALTETFEPAAKSAGLELQIEGGDEHTIKTDSVLLRNIVESFVSNAINYSNRGGVILVSVKKTDTDITFSVTDSGIGIPKDEQARLFERFYRTSNAQTFSTRGTGLGLYIAKTLSRKIGATITFESVEGKGSTFSVHVPTSSSEGLPENSTSV